MSAAETVKEQTQATPPAVWDGLTRALSPIEYRPRLLPEVEAAEQTTRRGVPYVVVRSPVANSYLKLDPREYELLALMDGTRTVKSLVVVYYQRHGVLALPRISALVRLLRARHFLTDPPVDVYAALSARFRRPNAGSFLLRLIRGFRQSEFSLPGVDRVLGSWYDNWARLFFTKPAALIGLILTLCGPVFFLLELGRGRYDLFHTGGSYLATILLMTGFEIVSLFIHEMGHGLAVKHARRQARRAGLMIYFGMPAGYVETTDIWMSPRRLRLLTSFAGPWTGLVLGGILAILAYSLPTGTGGAFLFVWGFVFLINNLMNFNPLLEFDGYYLLVDLLEKPMLRGRALSFVRRDLRRKFWRREKLSGEERFFALFGLASIAWTIFTIFMAVRLWQARVALLIKETWGSGDLLSRVVLIVFGALVLTPLLLGIWGGLRQLGRRAGGHFFWLRGKIAARRRREAIAALRAVPLWSSLPEARLLEIARIMKDEEVTTGRQIVRQGDQGERFYIIGQGEFEVTVDGEPVTKLDPGDYFGERALLDEVPRTATVTALTEGLLFSLDRAAFFATLAHDVTTRDRLKAALVFREELAGMPLFRDLSPTELDIMLTRLTTRTIAAGDAVFNQGDPGDHFYLIRAGQLAVVQDGKQIRTMVAGEAFGEIALLMEVPRTATVLALEPAELLALSAGDFRDMLTRYCGRAENLERLGHQRLDSDRQRLGSTGDLLHPAPAG